jgi:drug/metabolite transporter (DMT)-like permease
VTPPGRGRVVGAFVLLTLIWGTTWAGIRVGLAGVPPFTGVALRFAVAGTILLAFARRLGVRLGRSRHERGLWLTNGLLSFCASYSIVYWSEQYIPSGLAAVLFATNPLFVYALAHFVLPGERLGAPALGGLMLGFVGVAVIFSDDLRLLGGERVREAALVMLGSPLVSAVSTVLIKRWGSGVHPLSLGAVPMLLCAVVMAPVALAVEHDVPLVLDSRSVGALLYLAVLGSAVTFTIYYWLLARVSATQAALISYLIPIVAVAIGAAVFAEPLRPRLLAGSVLVLGGVIVVGTARRRPRGAGAQRSGPARRTLSEGD